MLSETILTALNWQLNHEQTNAQVYLLYSTIADYHGLTGACSWFAKQSQEEQGHAKLIYSYISDKGHVPYFLAIPEQPSTLMDLPTLMSKTVELEASTTANLQALAELCKTEGDDQTYHLILKMLDEQVEETKMTSDILQRLNISSSGAGLLLIDQELGKR